MVETHSAATTASVAEDFESRFVIAPDGLRLHVRVYGRRGAPGIPVVCLPGLARTAADFHALAVALSADRERPRRVLALDYRGRGLSDHDTPAHYNFAVELADVVAATIALDAAHAHYIGTSRGGLLTMMLAGLRPGAIASAILNDIGPVIEPKGLMRIKSYVGRLPEPRSYEEGAEILRRLFDSQFPKLTAQDWLANARRTWQERRGRLVPTYDVKLARTLAGVDLERPLPPLWKEFDALAALPVMVVRGGHSDILSKETLGAMQARRAHLDVLEVPDQGHAPLLAEADVLARIGAFLARNDRSH